MPFAAAPPPPPPPNIVVVLADDLGACDLGFYGSQDAETPNLDALARASLRHEAFYVAPVCAPTRASFLTGRDHLRTGVAHVHGGKDYLDLSETTVAQVLKAAGYATGMWGKWHNGAADGYLPHQRGFDEALTLRLYKHRGPAGRLNGAETQFPGRWADDVITERCLDFAARNRDRPFFAFVASMTPHGALDAPEDEVQRRVAAGMPRNLALLNAQVSLLDRAVGRLLAGLDALDTGGRPTIVLFFSDNGPAMNEGGFSDAERARRNTTGWRGWKGDVWENGIRSPLFLRAPGRFQPGTVTQPAAVIDLLPTFAAWAGAPLPARGKPLDGRDITPMLRGEAMPDRPVFTWVHPAIPPAEGRGPSRALQDEYHPVQPEEKRAMPAKDQVMCVRDGPWKLVRNGNINTPNAPAPREELHDVAANPLEREDQLPANHGQARRLRDMLDDWWRGILAEPASFQQPEMLLPAAGAAAFPAVTACRLSARLRNGVGAVTGFAHAGDTIAWRIQSAAARPWTPSFTWSKNAAPPPGARFRVACGGSETGGVARENGKITWESPIEIDAGPATLELVLGELPAGAAPFSLAGVRLDPAP